MILNLFSLPIYKVNLKNEIDLNFLESNLETEFDKSSSHLSPLEKSGGISTYATNCNLHLDDKFKIVADKILNHVRLYWKILDVDQRLEPVIDQCWSNIHYDQSYTDYHSHSLMPVVATFYVRSFPNSGDLILINPMEYGLTHIPYSVPIERKIETSIPVLSGDLILFPGWVRHKTGINQSGNSRIVMSHNIRFQGKFLSSESDFPHTKNNASYNHSEVEFLQNKILQLETVIESMKRMLTDER